MPAEPDRDLAGLLRRFESSSLGIMDPIRLVKSAIPADMSLKVTEIMPRLKDGGAFVKVQHDPSISASEIESTFGPLSARRAVMDPNRRLQVRFCRNSRSTRSNLGSAPFAESRLAS